jgi:hypothetical protein
MDQIIPESFYLGMSWSDHLNMALVMGEKYPRAALLESVYRFVTEDLRKKKPAAASSQPAKPWSEGWGQQQKK